MQILQFSVTAYENTKVVGRHDWQVFPGFSLYFMCVYLLWYWWVHLASGAIAPCIPPHGCILFLCPLLRSHPRSAWSGAIGLLFEVRSKTMRREEANQIWPPHPVVSPRGNGSPLVAKEFPSENTGVSYVQLTL
jgi:hypothetical protein